MYVYVQAFRNEVYDINYDDDHSLTQTDVPVSML